MAHSEIHRINHAPSDLDQPRKRVVFVIAIVAFLSLSSGFLSNQWGAVPEERFSQRAIWFDFLLLGRLMQSEQNGIFSAGGLIGSIDLRHGDVPRVQRHVYKAYMEGKYPEKFYRYKSQIGLLGMLASAFANMRSLSRKATLQMLQAFNAVATSLVLSALLFWVAWEFGALAAAFGLISLLSSDIVTNLGSSLHWSIWSFYLPFLAVIVALRREQTAMKPFSYRFWFLFFSALAFLKCVFSGYELVSTVLVMMVSPIVYFAVWSGWSLRRLTTVFATAVTAAVASLFASFVLLNIQIYFSDDEEARLGGIRHIIERFVTRTVGGESQKAEPTLSVWEVIWQHLSAPAVLISNLNITYLELLLAISAGTLILLGFGRYNIGNQRKNLALMAATWFSILAPLSWFVIFKQHAEKHPFVTLSWYMPFIFMGFILIGCATKEAFGVFPRRQQPK